MATDPRVSTVSLQGTSVVDSTHSDAWVLYSVWWMFGYMKRDVILRRVRR